MIAPLKPGMKVHVEFDAVVEAPERSIVPLDEVTHCFFPVRLESGIQQIVYYHQPHDDLTGVRVVWSEPEYETGALYRMKENGVDYLRCASGWRVVVPSGIFQPSPDSDYPPEDHTFVKLVPESEDN